MNKLELCKERQRELRLEEVFRDQVRKQLETGGPTLPRQKIWKALNEPFMIWILSTLLGGLLVWSYNQLTSTRSLHDENALAIERFNQGIAIRIEFAQLILRQAVATTDYENAALVLLYDTPLIRLDPQLEDRSTASLIWEAEKRAKSNRNLNAYLELLLSLDALRVKLSAPLDQKEHQKTLAEIREVMSRIARHAQRTL